MFIYSAKMNKKKLATIVSGITAVILALVFVFTGEGGDGSDPYAAEKELLQKARLTTNEDRLALLTELGWEIVAQPEESMEVRIPLEFSDVYERYNLIQAEQGMDLAEYKGETVMRYTYSIVNHPSGEKHVRATLLVKNGRLIGGDVCSAKMDGFMHSLLMPQTTDTAKTPMQTTAVTTTVTTSAQEPAIETQNVAPTVGGDENAFPTD